MSYLIASWVQRVVLAAAPAKKAPPSRPGSPLMHSLMFIGLMFFVLYFLMIRPQRKRQRQRMEMLEAVRKGDRVITTGGIHGTITLVRDREVVVKVDDNVKLTLSRNGIAQIIPRETEDAKRDKD